MPKHLEEPGFAPPAEHALGREGRSATRAELIASVGIAVCTVVAATAVSVGIARADGVVNIIENEGTLFTIALVLGVAFVAMGGLTALSLPARDKAPHRPKM